MNKPRAFVVGWPISHSRSPLIHRHWIARYGIDGDYVAEAVEPSAFSGFVRNFHRHSYVGGNVTLPHKEAAFAACDQRSEAAEKVSAVNTLWREGDRLVGDNTDGFGFTSNLDEQAPGWRQGGPALVLGAGGSARAIVMALVEAGFAPVHVLNRSVERARLLQSLFGDPVRAGPLALIADLLPNMRIVVNTTSAGMTGPSLAIDWRRADRDTIATDIVYVPLRTAFLQGAADEGLTTVDGLGMLLHQARPGFQRWFGAEPEVDEELRRIVLADLGV